MKHKNCKTFFILIVLSFNRKISFAVICVLSVLCCYDGLYLDCTYSFNSYTHVGSIYHCNAKVLNLNSADTIQGVRQHSATGKSNGDVKGFSATSQTLSTFPKNLDKYFANLQAIYINSCGLTKISSDDLKPFLHLTYITIAGNKI
jgi:hypothetical protein